MACCMFLARARLHETINEYIFGLIGCWKYCTRGKRWCMIPRPVVFVSEYHKCRQYGLLVPDGPKSDQCQVEDGQELQGPGNLGSLGSLDHWRSLERWV